MTGLGILYAADTVHIEDGLATIDEEATGTPVIDLIAKSDPARHAELTAP